MPVPVPVPRGRACAHIRACRRMRVARWTTRSVSTKPDSPPASGGAQATVHDATSEATGRHRPVPDCTRRAHTASTHGEHSDRQGGKAAVAAGRAAALAVLAHRARASRRSVALSHDPAAPPSPSLPARRPGWRPRGGSRRPRRGCSRRAAHPCRAHRWRWEVGPRPPAAPPIGSRSCAPTTRSLGRACTRARTHEHTQGVVVGRSQHEATPPTTAPYPPPPSPPSPCGPAGEREGGPARTSTSWPHRKHTPSSDMLTA